MGCCNYRLNCGNFKSIELTTCSDEDLIKVKEKSLPLSSISAEEIALIINKYQFEGYMSSAQLRQCFMELKFDVAAFSHCESEASKLMAALQSEKLYKTQIVSLCGLLLGEGKSIEKAKVLFSIYDTEESNSLSSETINKMLEDIINVSANRIPLIAADDNDIMATYSLPNTRVEAYITSLTSNKDYYMKKVLLELLPKETSINLQEFLQKVTHSRLLESLLWSYQVRLELTQTNR